MKNIKFNKIILHGFRASGKSTVGKLLASKLNWQFIDLDKYLEQKAAMSITAITHNGQDWNLMRQLEQRALQEVLLLQNVVIASGGGLVVNDLTGEENLRIIRTQSLLENILLEANAKVVARRIRESEELSKVAVRPVLSNESVVDVSRLNREQEIDLIVENSLKLLSAREKLYLQITNLVFNTDTDNELQTLEKIWETLMPKQK